MYAQDRVLDLVESVGERYDTGPDVRLVRALSKLGNARDYVTHTFWSKIERRVLVAVLDELVVQCKGSRFPAAKALRTTVTGVRDLLEQNAISTALGVFDPSYDALRGSLYGFSYGVPGDHHVHIVNTARAALAMPRDPLVLWDYMLEQLWLSAHDKTGGEAGMAQRLHDALVTIFEETVSSENPPSFR